MGKFRSLFDPEEVQQLGIDCGLQPADSPVGAAPTPVAAPRSLFADADPAAGPAPVEDAGVPLGGEVPREEAEAAAVAEPVPAAPGAPHPAATAVRLTTEGIPVALPSDSPVTMVPGSITRLPDPLVEVRAVATPVSTQSVTEQVITAPSRHVTLELEPAVPQETGFARHPSGVRPGSAPMPVLTAGGRMAEHLGLMGVAPWRMMLRASLISRVPSEAWFQTPEPEPHLVAALDSLGVSTPAGGLPWQG